MGESLQNLVDVAERRRRRVQRSRRTSALFVSPLPGDGLVHVVLQVGHCAENFTLDHLTVEEGDATAAATPTALFAPPTVHLLAVLRVPSERHPRVRAALAGVPLRVRLAARRVTPPHRVVSRPGRVLSVLRFLGRVRYCREAQR